MLPSNRWISVAENETAGPSDERPAVSSIA